MPRVTFVKTARKDNSVCLKGQSYYWWKFRYGGKRLSLTPPRPSQLTQSAYFGAVRALSEQVGDWFSGKREIADVEDFLAEIRDELESIGSECQDSLENIPESLQYAPTGELLQERIDACDNATVELESVDIEFESDLDDDADDDEIADEVNERLLEIESEVIECVDQCEI